jgi:hypothetical protein
MSTIDTASLPSIVVPPAYADVLTSQELSGLIRRHLIEKSHYEARGVDYAGLTSEVAPPLVAPARVRFRDVKTGRWIEGCSEPKIDPNHFRIDLNVRAYDPCRHKAHWGQACGCKKKLVGLREGPANLCTNVFANLVRVALMGTATTVTDVLGTGRAITATMNGGVASMLGCAGTGVTAATVADTNMQTQTETQASVTVNTVSGAGATGTFTVTFTITATADRAYTEVGLKNVTTTSPFWSFLLTHDSFSVLNVSSSGTLATTYTFQNT